LQPPLTVVQGVEKNAGAPLALRDVVLMVCIFTQGGSIMEFKQVIGRRRSIRHFLPWKPVEREKIQVMLEAAHQSSCAVNASLLQVIVIERDKLPKETLESLKTPVSANNLVCHVPDHWMPLWLLAVGYPAAGWEDGGRRPRPKKFEEQFCNGDALTLFRRDPEVVKQLEAEGMITPPAPTSGRKQEFRGISRMLGLPE